MLWQQVQGPGPRQCGACRAQPEAPPRMAAFELGERTEARGASKAHRRGPATHLLPTAC